MAQMKTAMDNVSKLATQIIKQAAKQATRLDNLSKSAEQWRDGGIKGIQELYTYVAQRVKQLNLDYNAVSADPISKYSDKNVAHYLEGLVFLISEGTKDSLEFTALSADNKALLADLTALEKPLSEAVALLKKKKKKLLVSLKYKKKLAAYENALTELQASAVATKRALSGVPKPPSPAKIQAILGITSATTLKVLQAESGSVVGKLEAYNSLILNLNETANEIRSKAEFATHMKMIKEMLAEAEDLEKEGD